MTAQNGHYAPINGLNMYYEIHGEGRPLLLLHGNLSAIESSFGKIWPELAQTRQVIAVEQQAHGRTADIDRPLTIQQMANDTLALLDYLGLKQVDIFAYSSGSQVALEMVINRPVVVGKLILMTISYTLDGMQPGLIEGISQIQPEMMAGTPWYEEYKRIAPHPENWGQLVEKIKRMDGDLPEYTDDTIRAIQSPVLMITGDMDVVTLEHVVKMFRLLGGGVMRMDGRLNKSELAVIPGTPHEQLPQRSALLLPMATAFLERE